MTPVLQLMSTFTPMLAPIPGTTPPGHVLGLLHRSQPGITREGQGGRGREWKERRLQELNRCNPHVKAERRGEPCWDGPIAASLECAPYRTPGLLTRKMYMK